MSAGIKHLFTQPERVEIVGNVVVITDCLPVALLGVKAAAQPCPTPHQAQLTIVMQFRQQNLQLRFLLESPTFIQKIIGKREDTFDVSLNIKVSPNVSFSKSQFAGVGKYRAYCPR